MNISICLMSIWNFNNSFYSSETSRNFFLFMMNLTVCVWLSNREEENYFFCYWQLEMFLFLVKENIEHWIGTLGDLTI